MNHYTHSLVKNGLEAFLCQSTAFHVLALELLLDDLAGRLTQNRGLFWVLLVHSVLFPQIDLVTDEDLRDVSHVFLQFGVPLSRGFITFLRALTKEEGSTTEKTMRKTSQFG